MDKRGDKLVEITTEDRTSRNYLKTASIVENWVKLYNNILYCSWVERDDADRGQVWLGQLNLSNHEWNDVKLSSEETNKRFVSFDIDLENNKIYFIYLDPHMYVGSCNLDGSDWTSDKKFDDTSWSVSPFLRIYNGWVYFAFIDSTAGGIKAGKMDLNFNNFSQKVLWEWPHDLYNAYISNFQIYNDDIYLIAYLDQEIYTYKCDINWDNESYTLRKTTGDWIGYIKSEILGENMYCAWDQFADIGGANLWASKWNVITNKWQHWQLTYDDESVTNVRPSIIIDKNKRNIFYAWLKDFSGITGLAYEMEGGTGSVINDSFIRYDLDELPLWGRVTSLVLECSQNQVYYFWIEIINNQRQIVTGIRDLELKHFYLRAIRGGTVTYL